MDAHWDAFLSYASEDRDTFAEPLFRLLTALGVRVWFDKTELKVGDSLRERIDSGLAHSRFGIVVLSPSFFAKHYPQRELNGLAQREVDGEKVLLPVWHNVTVETVRHYSPPLADRIALQSSDGVVVVASSLMPTLRPDLVEAIESEVRAIRKLPEITSGKQAYELFANAHAHRESVDEVSNEAEAELVGGFQSWAREIADIAEDLTPQEQLRQHLELSAELARLRDAGWKVFGERREEAMPLEDSQATWEVSVVAVLKSASGASTMKDGTVLVIREESAGQET